MGTNIPIEPAQPAGPAPTPGMPPQTSDLYPIDASGQLIAPGPAFPAPPEPSAPVSEKRSGFGVLGFLLIRLSLGAGVGIGLALYRYAPLP
jgi:hypothetical protein